MNLIYKPFFLLGIMIGILSRIHMMLTPGVVLVYVMVLHGLTSFHIDLSHTFVSVHEV